MWGLWESKPAKWHRMITVSTEMAVVGAFCGDCGKAHTFVDVQMYVNVSWPLESQKEPVLNLEFARRTDAGLWELVSTTWVIKAVFWQKRNHYKNSCCQSRTMERQKRMKTIKVRLFSVTLISFSCSLFFFFSCIGAMVSEYKGPLNHTQQWHHVPSDSSTPMRPLQKVDEQLRTAS